MSVVVALIAAGQLTLLETESLDDNFMRIELGSAQRCYSFSCFEVQISFATWKDMQENAYVTFYSRRGCRGSKIRVPESSGAFNASQYGMDKQVGSVMVLESGRYARLRRALPYGSRH